MPHSPDSRLPLAQESAKLHQEATDAFPRIQCQSPCAHSGSFTTQGGREVRLDGEPLSGVVVVPSRKGWPLPVAPDLLPVLVRLTALGVTWAARRGGDWYVVLNDGPCQLPGPLHRFRWLIVADAVRFASGFTETPPDEYAALPVGLREFLSWGVPAALSDSRCEEPDLDRSRASLADAARFVEELTQAVTAEAAPQRPSSGPVVRQPAGSTAEPVCWPTKQGSDRTPDRQAPTPASIAGALSADPASLLAGALAPAAIPPIPGAAREVLVRLREGPLPFAELRRIGRTHGVLPGSLLDALDVVAVRATGSPATRIDGNEVCLRSEYVAVVARGEDPFE